MKLHILRNTVAGGKPVQEGTTAEVSDRDAGILIAMGKARPATTGKREAAAVKQTETADRPAPKPKSGK